MKFLQFLATRFQKRAQIANSLQFDQYAQKLIDQMKGLGRGMEVSVKHLISLPKYHSSVGLQELNKMVPQLISSLSALVPQNLDMSLDNVEEILGGMAFYTSSGNTGTGFDPATTAKEGGFTPPAYYVSQLSQMTKQLKGKVLDNKTNTINNTSGDIA